MRVKNMLRIVSGAFLLAGLCGCGDVEWFPGSDTTNTSGDPTVSTSLITDTVTVAVASTGVATTTPTPLTVSGTSTVGWPVSISSETPAGIDSKFSIANGTFGTSGTILPNQTLSIQHKPSTSVNTTVTTVVKIGQGQFVTYQTSTVPNP